MRSVSSLCIVAALLCVLGLSGCGQRGPLYLPNPNTPNATDVDSKK